MQAINGYYQQWQDNLLVDPFQWVEVANLIMEVNSFPDSYDRNFLRDLYLIVTNFSDEFEHNSGHILTKCLELGCFDIVLGIFDNIVAVSEDDLATMDLAPFTPLLVSDNFINYVRDTGNNDILTRIKLPLLYLAYHHGNNDTFPRLTQLFNISQKDWIWLSTVRTGNIDSFRYVYTRLPNEEDRSEMIGNHISNGDSDGNYNIISQILNDHVITNDDRAFFLGLLRHRVRTAPVLDIIMTAIEQHGGVMTSEEIDAWLDSLPEHLRYQTRTNYNPSPNRYTLRILLLGSDTVTNFLRLYSHLLNNEQRNRMQ